MLRKRVVAVVEGHGEVESLPLLLRRVLSSRFPGQYFELPRPIRAPRDKLVNDEKELARVMALASAKARADGAVLLLLDADDDCPAELGSHLKSRCGEVAGVSPIGVVLACREYESWFLAAAESLAGYRGLPKDLTAPFDSEVTRDAKGWVRQHRGLYDSRLDQAALTSRIDLRAAERNSRSFRKLCSEIETILKS